MPSHERWLLGLLVVVPDLLLLANLVVESFPPFFSAYTKKKGVYDNGL